ncbi:MAG: methyltransferase domain-containing protein, partial [Candidatus Coatesbacteria bacterium]|nr:methyltransferase domain-containing protein [Candidatus Coatesbacteria bacterium]
MTDTAEGRYQGTDPRLFAAYLPYLRSCNRILDYGCGSGAFLRWAKVRELVAEGYEPDAVIREMARAGGAIVHGEMPDLARFDALVLICVIEHLDRA